MWNYKISHVTLILIDFFIQHPIDHPITVQLQLKQCKQSTQFPHHSIMQTLVLPATCSGISRVVAAPIRHLRRPSLTLCSPNYLTLRKAQKPEPLLSASAPFDPLSSRVSKPSFTRISSSQVSPSFTSSNDDTEKAKLALVRSPSLFTSFSQIFLLFY